MTAHSSANSSNSPRSTSPDHDGRTLESQLQREPNPVKRFFKMLGPGLITGASDDDPSGIGTYSMAGASLGYSTLWMAGVKKLITIVHPHTYRRWSWQSNNHVPKKRIGRPRTPEAVRELVLKLARETGWGYTRILGELRKLGYTGISRQTVVNILKREGFDPWPKRGPGTWDELLKMHAETLWQCDFFSKRMLVRRGIRQAFALVFLNIASRRVWVSPSTCHLTDCWIEEQIRAFGEHTEKNDLNVKLVTRDRDRNYRKVFDKTFSDFGAEVMPLAYRSPNLNAYVERFIQSIQVECLDHFLVFGEKHFDYLVREYVEHYHTERPHQGLDNILLNAEPPPETPIVDIQCGTRLGGLLKHYFHAAA